MKEYCNITSSIMWILCILIGGILMYLKLISSFFWYMIGVSITMTIFCLIAHKAEVKRK